MKTKENSPLIVLHVVGRLDMGGAESRVMDIYRRMDRSKVQFYFVQHTMDRCFFAEEIEKLGGEIFSIPRFNVLNILSYKKAWKQLFREHPEIRIVHGHMTSTAAIYLPIAKSIGIEVTIAHARSAGVDPGLKGKVTRFLRKDLWKKCDHCFTCSHQAGESAFGKQAVKAGKVEFIPNAIEADRFAFDAAERKRLRDELGISKAFVLGHVGRFSPVKNHEYLLEILKECIKEEKEAPVFKLMLLGEGPLMESIRQQAEEKGLSDRVLFLGNQREVYRYYQAMDFFLLPSFYEGLPGTAIEAQASGLAGMISDTITPEAVVTDLIRQGSIQAPPSEWAEVILQNRRTLCRTEEEYEKTRSGYSEQVKEAGYDAGRQVKRLEKFYLTGQWK